MAERERRRGASQAADPNEARATEQNGSAATSNESAASSSEPKLAVEFSADGLKAVVPAVYPSTTVEEILDLLRSHGVSSKYIRPVIRSAIEVARETNQVVSDVVVAEGRPPKSAASLLEHHPPKGLDRLPALEAIQELLVLPDRDEVVSAAPEVRGWIVKPGHKLATLSIPEGAEGVDVRDRPIPPIREAVASDAVDPCKPGTGVELAANGRYLIASAYGYAGLLGGQVWVLAPIWLSPGQTEACFLRVHLMAGSVIPSPQHLRELLEASGVISGIESETLEAFTQAQKQRLAPESLFTLASGRQAVAPVNPRVSFNIEHDPRGGTTRSDGTIDFKQRGLFPSVRTDALLAECRTAVPGTPGKTVSARKSPSPHRVLSNSWPGKTPASKWKVETSASTPRPRAQPMSKAWSTATRMER